EEVALSDRNKALSLHEMGGEFLSIGRRERQETNHIKWLKRMGTMRWKDSCKYPPLEAESQNSLVT
ncbi:hypothetical protein EK21DRAFT_65398, partial [Setomelanomma holmii]